MLPIKDKKNKEMEPSLAVKMALLRIVQDMNLSPDEIKRYAVNLTEILKRNENATQIAELKDLCKTIVKMWNFTLYKNFKTLQHKS